MTCTTIPMPSIDMTNGERRCVEEREEEWNPMWRFKRNNAKVEGKIGEDGGRRCLCA